MIKIIALSGTLSDTGKNGISAVCGRDVVDQFLDQHRFSDARTAKKPDLSTFLIRAEQIDDLDPGLKHLSVRRLLGKLRRFPVDRHVHRMFWRCLLIDRLP